MLSVDESPLQLGKGEGSLAERLLAETETWTNRAVDISFPQKRDKKTDHTTPLCPTQDLS